MAPVIILIFMDQTAYSYKESVVINLHAYKQYSMLKN